MTPHLDQPFVIEHQCPQCGSPAELYENDRFFRCGFCRVSSLLSAPGLFRYILPPSDARSTDPLIYFPYWRFKGMLFACLMSRTEHRFIDVSHQALGCRHVPLSLGFRSQTQKLRFASAAGANAVFLRPGYTREQFMHLLDQRFSGGLPKPMLHQAYIGETVSLIYAPFFLRKRFVDALPATTAVAADAGMGADAGAGADADAREAAALLEQNEQPAWPITFLPAICQHCGWDLESPSDALVLPCRNCRKAFQPQSGKLIEVDALHAPAPPEAASRVIFMPFWRIQAQVEPVRLQTYADLIRLANLPKVIQPGSQRRPFYFWSPAFKVRPQTLLTLASQICLYQPDEELRNGIPDGALHGVNMPSEEAVESLKVVLAGCMRPRERAAQVIGGLSIAARQVELVYLPFRQSRHELIHDCMKLAINRNQLAHARHL